MQFHMHPQPLAYQRSDESFDETQTASAYRRCRPVAESTSSRHQTLLMTRTHYTYSSRVEACRAEHPRSACPQHPNVGGYARAAIPREAVPKRLEATKCRRRGSRPQSSLDVSYQGLEDDLLVATSSKYRQKYTAPIECCPKIHDLAIVDPAKDPLFKNRRADLTDWRGPLWKSIGLLPLDESSRSHERVTIGVQAGCADDVGSGRDVGRAPV